MLVAFFACALWVIMFMIQLGTELIGPGKGLLGDQAMGLRIGLAVVWLAAAIGAAVFGKQSLDFIKRSDGRWGGRGEARAAIFLSLGTIVITVVALIVYGVFQTLG